MPETAVRLGAFETRGSTYRLTLVMEPDRPVLLRVGIRKRSGWELAADVRDLGQAEALLRKVTNGHVGLENLTRWVQPS